MHLALGSLQLHPTVRTVVVGLLEASAARVEPLEMAADALWLRGPVTPAHVAEVCERTGLPVGVTVDHADLASELVAAGAVALEAASAAVDVVDEAGPSAVALWCTPADARRAGEAGVAPDRIIVEGGGPGIAGITVDGAGPAAWGAVLGSVFDGVRVVRTADARAVRRVVTVADRLLAARADAQVGAPS